MKFSFTTCGSAPCQICKGYRFGEPSLSSTELKLCGVEAIPVEIALIIMDVKHLRRRMEGILGIIFKCGRGMVHRGRQKFWPLEKIIKLLDKLVMDIVEYSSTRREPSEEGLFVSATAYAANTAAKEVIVVILYIGELLGLLLDYAKPFVALEYNRSSLAKRYFTEEDPTLLENASTDGFQAETKHLEEEIKRLTEELIKRLTEELIKRLTEELIKRLTEELALTVVPTILSTSEGGYTLTVEERNPSIRLFRQVEEVLSLIQDVKWFKFHIDAVAKNAEGAFTALMEGP